MKEKLKWVWAIFWGVFLGYSLGRIGFPDLVETRRMFGFESWRMWISFAGAVALLIGLYRLVPGRNSWPKRTFHVWSIPGGLIFGIGWALSGGCPTIPWVQLGQGQWIALVTLPGVLIGLDLSRRIREKFPSINQGEGCG